MIYEWSPIHLRNVLKQWYLKEGVNDVSALKVCKDRCHYLYLPRLVNDSVFRNAINQGVESEDYFASASAREGDRYLGFTFGRGSIATLDESSLLIDREAAVAYLERTQQAPQPGPEPGGVGSESGSPTTPAGGTGGTGIPAPTPGESGGAGTTTPAVTKKQFYGDYFARPGQSKNGLCYHHG